MDQPSANEPQAMDASIKKGFLESSEEFFSMQPFKEHPRGFAAYSLSRSGSSEHHKFCECFDPVVSDDQIEPRQGDPSNILEKWRKVCAVDEDELVCFISVRTFI